MPNVKFAGIATLAVTLACLGLLFAPAFAQIKKGKDRPALTKQLMRGIMAPNCGGLKKSLSGDGPADDKAWALAAQQAACMNEMSYLLMSDGRCPDGVWANAATKALRGGTVDILAAIEKKDSAAASAAFKAATKSCGACHSKHKK
jgi:cytochrome c556